MFKEGNNDNTTLQLNRTIQELKQCKDTLNNTILQLGVAITQLRDTNEELCEIADCTQPKAKQLCPVTCVDGMYFPYQVPISFYVLLFHAILY